MVHGSNIIRYLIWSEETAMVYYYQQRMHCTWTRMCGWNGADFGSNGLDYI